MGRPVYNPTYTGISKGRKNASYFQNKHVYVQFLESNHSTIKRKVLMLKKLN